MNLPNFLSELFLSLSGFLVYYIFPRKLRFVDSILWGTFIVSVSITSFCSALYFAGVPSMELWHDFFKNIGSSIGIVLLVMGIYSLVMKHSFSKKTVFTVFLMGLSLVFLSMFLKQDKLLEFLPLVGILIALLFGIFALIKKKSKLGIYLLLATLFSILANTFGLLELPINPLTTYCVLLSLVLLCFGLAANQERH